MKKREYRKHGKSEKYRKLLEKFDQKYEIAANDHLEKYVRSLKEDNPGKAYSVLKKMGSQPGDCLDEGSFQLTEHVEANLSLAESAEKIAEHFALISQSYQPLDITKLPTYVKDIIEDTIHAFELPTLKKLRCGIKLNMLRNLRVGYLVTCQKSFCKNSPLSWLSLPPKHFKYCAHPGVAQPLAFGIWNSFTKGERPS